MFDSTSTKAAELLSYFGRNTAVTVQHRYGTNECVVLSARTGNVIAEVELDDSPMAIAAEAYRIMGMRKFPKGRKMNKAWSPIRLTAKAQADAEIAQATAVHWTI